MKKTINSEKAPAPIGPYNQAILIDNMLFTSGQIAIDAQTNELLTDNIKDETIKVMENLKEVLLTAKMDFNDVVKCSIFLSNMDNFLAVNDVYSSYFTNLDIAPARETVEVARLPKNVNVEISMIAVKSK